MYSDQRVKDKDSQGLNIHMQRLCIGIIDPPTPTHTHSQSWVSIIKQVLHDDGNKYSLLQFIRLKNVLYFIVEYRLLHCTTYMNSIPPLTKDYS